MRRGSLPGGSIFPHRRVRQPIPRWSLRRQEKTLDQHLVSAGCRGRLRSPKWSASRFEDVVIVPRRTGSQSAGEIFPRDVHGLFPCWSDCLRRIVSYRLAEIDRQGAVDSPPQSVMRQNPLGPTGGFIAASTGSRPNCSRRAMYSKAGGRRIRRSRSVLGAELSRIFGVLGTAALHLTEP